jgi:hypothetical protein
LLVEATGGPLAVVIAGANVHDTKLLAATLAAVVVERPQPSTDHPQHLCLDKGYDNPTGEAAIADHHYVLHIQRIGEERRGEAGPGDRREALSRALLGGGKDAGVALEVPCAAGALRQA